MEMFGSDPRRGNRRSRAPRPTAAEGARRAKLTRRQATLEPLEPRCLLAVTNLQVSLGAVPVEGASFGTASPVVAQFVSNESLATDFTAAVTFPSGSTSANVSQGSQVAPGQYQYTVNYTGNWTPADESAGVPFTVTVHDNIDSAQAVVNGTTPVRDAALTFFDSNPIPSFTEGVPSSNFPLMRFTDADPSAPTTDFTGTIDWGDGTTSAASFSYFGSQVLVSGTHTYAEAISNAAGVKIAVSVTDKGGQTVSGATSAVTVNDQPLTNAAGLNVNGAMNQTLGLVPVATFTDPNPLATAGDFNVTIDWGDGNTSPGVVTRVSGSDTGANFLVTGSNTYTSSPATPFTITTSIVDRSTPNTTVTATSSATITTSPLAVGVLSQNTTDGTALPSGASAVLAIVKDPNGPDPLSNYSATINWGDGTSSTVPAASITVDPNDPAAVDIASPGHTYSGPGLYPITVTVVDTDGVPEGPTVGVGNGFAVVSPVAITATPMFSSSIFTNDGTALPASTPIGSFDVADPNATAGDFTATIDWGDGTTPTTGTVVLSGTTATTATFLVEGGHTYADSGTFTPTVTFRDNDGTAVNSRAATASVKDAPLSGGTAVPVSATVNQPLVNVPVSTFVDANPDATPADFTATINWGDGTTSPGFVQRVGSEMGGALFEVSGTHAYTVDPGEPLTMTVTVTDVETGGGTVTVNPTATVNAGAIVVQVLPQTATIDQTFTPGSASQPGVIATFLDLGGAHSEGNYFATIEWGDGSTDTGTVMQLSGNNYIVTAPDHAYHNTGPFVITVTVGDDTDQETGVGAGVAAVQDSTLTASPPAGGTVTPTNGGTVTEGQPATLTVATFTDTDTQGLPSDYQALIDWGDGTSSYGTVVSTGTPGSFSVQGIHTYSEATTAAGIPSYTVTTTVTDNFGGRTVTGATVASVADAPLSAGTVLPIVVGVNQPLNDIPVATFVDANPDATAADFAAAINWGDAGPGTFDANARVVLTGANPNGPGALFTVYGSHSYAAPGMFSVSVRVTDEDGSTLSASALAGTVMVTPAPQMQVVISPAPVSATEGVALPSAQTIPAGGGAPATVVATFYTLNGTAPPGTYSATIDWGNGVNGGADTVTPGTIVPLGSGFAILAPAGTAVVYPEEGDDTIRVALTDAIGNVMAYAVDPVRVGDALLSASSTQPAIPPQTQGAASGLIPVATFTDANPLATAADFTATIDWGDGTPNSVGTILPTGAPGVFAVSGAHTYANLGTNIGGTPSQPTGTFPITVTVRDDGGATLTLDPTATVNEVPITVTGALTPSSDTGKYQNDGVTNDNQPTFSGTSAPGSVVRLTATPVNGGAPVVMGQTTAAADGSWALTSNRLPDGTYMITATGQDQAGLPAAPAVWPITAASNGGPNLLTVDTVGPRVVNTTFNRFTGAVSLTFSDSGGSGLSPQSLQDPANYTFNTQQARPPGRYLIGGLNVVPGSGAGDQTVNLSVVTTNRGRVVTGQALRGFFQVTARAASAAYPNGIQDLAGNALDGEFYGPFAASGNGLPGGDFVANFNNYHLITNPPASVIGTVPGPNDPAGQFPTRRVTLGSGNTRRAAHPRVVTKPATGNHTPRPSAAAHALAVHDLALGGATVPGKNRKGH